MSTLPPILNALSLAAQRDKGKLASADSWLLLADLNWQGTHIRIARNTDPVTFDAGDGLGPQTYQAFNFDLSIDQPSGTQLPSISLKCSNVMGLLQSYIEEYAGVVGAMVTLFVVNTAHAAGEASLAVSTIIMRTSCSRTTVTFSLGAPKAQQQLFPRYLYRADFCIWVTNYKGKWCGYTGTIPNCDGTYSGANGCVAHANQQRFGAFPGIGTNGAALASST